MAKLWEGRFSKETDSKVNDFNSSIPFDSRMIAEDIKGSMAHAAMLGAQNIIEPSESEKIIDGLQGILNDIQNGKLDIDMTAEDVHTFVEGELTKRLGSTGKRLHTARSRNDQVALDIRLYLTEETNSIVSLLKNFINTLCDIASKHADTVMCGYTHMQRAQPITFGHHIMAYAWMALRDIDRLEDCKKRMNISPLGSCALAGTTYPLDREAVSKKLGMLGITQNSLDGVSDRDFCIELMSCLSIVMMHLSKFCEEIILWCSWEFKYIELDDAYSTGSSIMPQKKNPDIAELVRGKTGRVYGSLITLLTVMKGIPLAYNKDMQEDKEACFDAVDTVKMCIDTMIPMLQTMTINKENMRTAAAKGFINATDCADYLTKKGMPFRDAYKAVGTLVALCIKENETLESLSIEKYKEISDVFDDDIYSAISLDTCIMNRNIVGAPATVDSQIKNIKIIYGIDTF